MLCLIKLWEMFMDLRFRCEALSFEEVASPQTVDVMIKENR